MKNLVLILCLHLPVTMFAQNWKENIEEDFMVYVDHIIDKEFDQAMDYTYERFFELIPRERMVAMMAATFNDPGMEYEISRADITSIGDPQKIDKEHFALLDYVSTIRMKFLPEEEEETQEEFEMRMDITRLSLEELFGRENVHYEAETAFWRITAQKKVCAISKNGKSDWHFLVLEKAQLPYLKEILPEMIIAGAE